MNQRINAYLSGGGLFNPDLAVHDNVRDLLIDCRDYIDFLEKRLEHSTKMHEHAMNMANKLMGKLK